MSNKSSDKKKRNWGNYTNEEKNDNNNPTNSKKSSKNKSLKNKSLKNKSSKNKSSKNNSKVNNVNVNIPDIPDIPNFPGLNAFLNSGLAKQDYFNIVYRYYDVFIEVCNLRNTEINLAYDAKQAKKSGTSNNIAFFNLRLFKDNFANRKNELYHIIELIENNLNEIFSTDKEIKNFINSLNGSHIFKLFMQQNPLCDKKIHPSYDYNGVKRYLKYSKQRPNVIANRKIIEQEERRVRQIAVKEGRRARALPITNI
jgi:hypothetical protein